MITVKRKVKLKRDAHRRRDFGNATVKAPVELGRTPRISRLMALAIRMERMLRTGEVADLTELARLGHVTQPRVTQIMNLLRLAPDIQEELLFLPRVTEGKAAIHEKRLRPIAAETDWARQREMWTQIAGSAFAAE
jgi:hypothetical protein